MPKKDDIYHSILVVSTSEQLNRIVKKAFTGFITMDIRKSTALARRSILERYYDIVVINAPLPDETGEAFAIDVTEKSNASVLLITPQNVFEETLSLVTDAGVLVIPKPALAGRIDSALRFLTSIQNRIHRLETKNVALEDKMEELRTVSKAKILLVEKKQMTEDEAHRFIGKMAMDNGISRGKAAKRLLDDF